MMIVYKFNNCGNIIDFALQSFIDTIKTVVGEQYSNGVIDQFNGESGFVFCLFDDLGDVGCKIAQLKKKCFGDGFAITKINKTIFVLSHTERGVLYGVHQLLEDNLDVIFSRGAKDCDVDYEKADCVEWHNVEKVNNTPFSIRAFNVCGVGSEGLGHLDDGTAEFFAKNKCNATFHTAQPHWDRLGIFCNGRRIKNVQVFDDLAKSNPEFFMTDADGNPKSAFGGCESYPNYYNENLPKVLAQRIVSGIIEGQDIYHWTMPDSSYFFVKSADGLLLHEMPFTSDDGITVYPQDVAYKSTVYFNFLNRLIKRVNELRPNTYLSVFSYIYSEIAPDIEIDPHLIILYAPITTNDRYSYIDKQGFGNEKIKLNIEKWATKTKNLYVYTYWQCFCSTKFSRPILNVVKENLQWFRDLSIKGVTVEGSVDCTLKENLLAQQRTSRLVYDMNQFFIWAICKLIWNPDEDINQLLYKYAKIVYKECSQEFIEYINLLQLGWDNTKTNVWYSSGGDVYYLQMIIKNGLADKLLSILEKAREKAKTPEVARKIQAIYSSVKQEIDVYSSFVKEDALATRVPNNVELLTESALDWINNPKSIWNKVKSLIVLRNNRNMAFYPKESKFSCKIAYDDMNLYFGYTIFDDQLAQEIIQQDGRRVYYRKDGSEVISCAETYVGGDVFNQSVYYGYTSGLMGVNRNEQGDFYRNENGEIKSIKIPDGVKTVNFVKIDKEKQGSYYYHVQIIPFSVLNENVSTAKPYGSFVYASNRYGFGGWMGYGLWCKQNFQEFLLEKNKEIEDEEKN